MAAAAAAALLTWGLTMPVAHAVPGPGDPGYCDYMRQQAAAIGARVLSCEGIPTGQPICMMSSSALHPDPTQECNDCKTNYGKFTSNEASRWTAWACGNSGAMQPSAKYSKPPCSVGTAPTFQPNCKGTMQSDGTIPDGEAVPE
jgi:hypothetical protein